MENRTEKITFRVTPSELKIIENKAKESNIKVSEYVRQSSLGKDIIVIRDLEELVKEVNAIGRNLNQLAILCHQGKITCLKLDYVENKLDKVWQSLNLLVIKTKRKRN
ncbi:plasmid mobilization protein [Sporanaerobacter acetigenes]|uniref:Mobilisation protein (MobC) n=1 Tax=Sporanaerobacter acetigenes DSM 13106 TaxID=1123281 RepID=A0A1M5UA68_9FIRM|nr:plasmid mobilization relaxosome protein MobC [Sporanaerobacter acetigenes]SHH59945.1 mobilisation protein (MobC) [Sporanaerobacter acetigenes DSM 13106]